MTWLHPPFAAKMRYGFSGPLRPRRMNNPFGGATRMFGRFSYGADLAKVVALVGLSLFSSAFACAPARADFFSDLFGGGRGDGRVYGSAIPRETVPYHGPEKPGTIIVATSERRLYYVLGDGQALKYGVGVGRSGFEWSGAHHVSDKREWPAWTPPSQM